MIPGTRADAATWRFRRLAALYPTRWLVEHGEAYVGTMLDVADAEGRTRPVAREWFSAVRHAATVWGSELGRRSAGAADLRSFGLVGRTALVSGSALSLLALVFGEWGPWWLFAGRTPHWPDGVGGRTTGVVLYSLWLVALGLVLAGRTAWARPCLLAATVTPGALAVLHAAGGPDRPPAGVLLALTVFGGAATTLRPPGRRARVALAGASVGVATAAAAWFVSSWLASPYREYTAPLRFGFYRQSGLPALAQPIFWVAVGAAVVGVLALPWRPGVMLAAAVVGTPWAWFSFTTVTSPGVRDDPVQGAFALVLLAVPGAAAGVVALAVARRRHRAA